jgi:hypothetical protein
MWIPGLGFTYLIEFGARDSRFELPEMRSIRHYEVPDSVGYDGKVYVQIAMRPGLDRTIRSSVSGVAYRARRILLPWVDWVLALGDPRRILWIYALQNVACWLGLAWLIRRWMPLGDWQGCVRWALTLYSFGLIFSVRSSLLDGPCLLLIAAGVALLEAGRRWSGSVVLGISGLGKETSVLGGAALDWPRSRRPAEWLRCAGMAALVVLPLVAWVVILDAWVGRGIDVGARNFGAPLAAMFSKVREILSVIRHGGSEPRAVAVHDLCATIGLCVQLVYFAAVPNVRSRWWRIGASYAALMIFLGTSVWEGYPAAAARVVLPMTLAFNILVPRGRRWIAILLLGNLGVLGSPDLLAPPLGIDYWLTGPARLTIDPATGRSPSVDYAGPNWWNLETQRFGFRRWTRGDAALVVRNPLKSVVDADISFALQSRGSRDVAVTLAGKTLWQGKLGENERVHVRLIGVRLVPGATTLELATDRPPVPPGPGGKRDLSFSILDLRLSVTAAP